MLVQFYLQFHHKFGHEIEHSKTISLQLLVASFVAFSSQCDIKGSFSHFLPVFSIFDNLAVDELLKVNFFKPIARSTLTL